MTYIGIDGSPDGWFAVIYSESGYQEAKLYDSIERVWSEHGDVAENVLVDVPIGLRENSSEPRPCDERAREKLGWPRSSSVYPVPVRGAVHEKSYSEAKAIQEKKTNGSLGKQVWNICDNIAEVDIFLRKTKPTAQDCVRESHPEICFWALNNPNEATEYSKTGQPAAGFWERVGILEEVDKNVLQSIRDAATELNKDVGNDDIVDAFALALTASPKTGEIRRIGGEEDSEGISMEMVYAHKGE